MVNNSYIFRRGKEKHITKKEILDTITEINNEHFNGELPIEEGKNFDGYLILPTKDMKDSMVIMCLPYGYTECHIETGCEQPVSGNHIEFVGRHCPLMEVAI